jgi:ketosteroid isomerase-like protein
MDEESREIRLERAAAETRTAFVAALRAGDAVAAARVYTDEARLVAPSAEPIRGQPAIEAFWRAGLAAGIYDVELQALELERVGKLAYEIGRYALRLQPTDGERVVDRGKYLLVHQRQADGGWRRAVEMFGPDAPPGGAGATP